MVRPGDRLHFCRTLPVPSVFISYSWDSPAHREWVARFAADLRNAQVDVILDQWHIQLGDDVTQFMEQAISSAEFILLICTEKFAENARARRSGVGYEQAIVTSELLNTQTPRGRFVCGWGPIWQRRDSAASLAGGRGGVKTFAGAWR